MVYMNDLHLFKILQQGVFYLKTNKSKGSFNAQSNQFHYVKSRENQQLNYNPSGNHKCNCQPNHEEYRSPHDPYK